MGLPRNYRQAPQLAGVAFALFLVAWGTSNGRLAAHEIPADVTVHVLVKPEGRSLQLLVRAPLESMRDVIFPTHDSVFLDLAAAERPAQIAAELWIANGVRAFENGQLLGHPTMEAVRVSLPSDRSFDSWEQALAHVTGPPLPADTQVVLTQARVDVLLKFATQSDGSAFSIETDFARLGLRTQSVVRFLPPGGQMRLFQYMGDAGVLHLDPRWHQAARRFVNSGMSHILGGIDHLLFLLCLVVPVVSIARPGWSVATLKPLVLMATAFTVAHSVTLIAAAYDFVPSGLWFPPFVEALIALSIVWMAIENIVSGMTASASNTRRRWVLTCAFGLVHGFGFSFALRDTLQFGGSHFVTSLVAFNMGVEIGQVFALLAIVPVLHLFFRYVTAERLGAIIVSALVAHHAWHWMLERGQTLFEHGWPFTTRESLSFALRAAIAAWLAGWGYWYLRRRKHRDV